MFVTRSARLFKRKMGLFRREERIHRETSGMRGVLALYAHLVCGQPKRLAINAKGIKQRLFVRLGTSDAEAYREVFLNNEYEFPTAFDPRNIVDVGANCGMTSIFYANRYPGARIWALEPETSNYQALVHNTRGYANVIPMRAALWKTDGQVETFSKWPRLSGWDKWGFRVREGVGCPALTLTTLMQQVGIETVDILKIDVEAGEKEIFDTCDWMSKVKLLAIELHDRDTPGCSEAVDSAALQHQKVQRGAMAFYTMSHSQRA